MGADVFIAGGSALDDVVIVGIDDGWVDDGKIPAHGALPFVRTVNAEAHADHGSSMVRGVTDASCALNIGPVREGEWKNGAVPGDARYPGVVVGDRGGDAATGCPVVTRGTPIGLHGCQIDSGAAETQIGMREVTALVENADHGLGISRGRIPCCRRLNLLYSPLLGQKWVIGS